MNIPNLFNSFPEFIYLVSKMDIGLQVSLSETYNIVTADFVNQEVPVITSKEIPFVSSFSQVSVTKNAKEIKEKINKKEVNIGQKVVEFGTIT